VNGRRKLAALTTPLLLWGKLDCEWVRRWEQLMIPGVADLVVSVSGNEGRR